MGTEHHKRFSFHPPDSVHYGNASCAEQRATNITLQGSVRAAYPLNYTG